jgi:hypothetical protein
MGRRTRLSNLHFDSAIQLPELKSGSLGVLSSHSILIDEDYDDISWFKLFQDHILPLSGKQVGPPNEAEKHSLRQSGLFN